MCEAIADDDDGGERRRRRLDRASKCTSSLATYASIINANLPAGTPHVTVDKLTCNITNFLKIASDCPNTDPPGQPEPLFAGGPAQYVANLAGQVNVAADTGTPLGTVSTTTNTSGQIGYAILPIDRACPPQGCQLLVTQFGLHVDDFSLSASFLGVTLFDEHVSNMSIQNVGWITGTWQPDGHFTIPAGTASVVITADINGSHGSFDRANGDAITGTIDPVTGAVSFDQFSQKDSSTTLTVTSLGGTNFRSPPVAVISLADTIECSQTGAAAVTLDATASQGADLHFFNWSVNDGAAQAGVQVPATLPLGPNLIGLSVMNATFGVGVATKTVVVADTTPPAFAGPLPSITDDVCAPGIQAATIPVPTASDVCSAGVTVTGAVISSNGVPLTTPVPVVAGAVVLPAGVHVIQWTATDATGNASTITQTLTVRPGFEASKAIAVDPRSRVLLPSGGFAMLGNSGPGRVDLDPFSQVGSVLSRGPVDVETFAAVTGDVRSAGDVHLGHGASVTGAVAAHASIALPPGRDLAGVAFPTSNAGRVDVRHGQTRALAPGAYSVVTVQAFGALTLTAGTYFFEELDLLEQSRVDLDQSGGAVRLFVHRAMVFQGQVQTTAGAPGGFVLGYAGTRDLDLRSEFLAGTVIAPNATVEISAHTREAFRGELFAATIELEPGTTAVCDPVGLSVPPHP